MGAKELFFKLRKLQNGIKPSCAQNPQLQRISTNESLTFSLYERRKATHNKLAKERGARSFLVEEEQRKKRKDEKNRIKNEAKEARQMVAEEYATGQLSLQEMKAQLKKSRKEEKAQHSQRRQLELCNEERKWKEASEMIEKKYGIETPLDPDEDDTDGEWNCKGGAVSPREWA